MLCFGSLQFSHDSVSLFEIESCENCTEPRVELNELPPATCDGREEVDGIWDTPMIQCDYAVCSRVLIAAAEGHHSPSVSISCLGGFCVKMRLL